MLYRLSIPVLLFALITGCLVGVADAEETLWKELNAKAVELFQNREYEASIEAAQEALSVAEQTFSADDHRIAASLNNLAALYRVRGKALQAEVLFQRAIDIWSLDTAEHEVNIRTAQKNLIAVYKAQGKYSDARSLASQMNQPLVAPAKTVEKGKKKVTALPKRKPKSAPFESHVMIALDQSIVSKLTYDERSILEQLLDKAVQRISDEHRERMYALHELYRGERDRKISREELEELRAIHNRALAALSEVEKKNFHQLVLLSATRSSN